jgi:anti-sigma factor RsiW
MTDIKHEAIRDLLPDLLHGRLSASEKSAIESHLAGCADCRSELEVLQMVQAAPSFEPRINAAKVASVIPPYSMRAYQAPAATRVPSRIFLTLAAAVVIVGSVVLVRGREGAPVTSAPAVSVAVTAPVQKVVRTAPAVATVEPVSKERTTSRISAQKPRELQLATGLDGLSDGGVKQLLRELDSFDGLPSAEPDPVGLTDQGSGGAQR